MLTNLANQWQPNSKSNKHLTQRCIDTVNAAKKQKDIKIIAIIWNQGEGDSKTDATAKQYQTNLKKLIKRLRSEVAEKDTPFLAARINPTQTKYPKVQTVRKAIEMKYHNYDWINLDDLRTANDQVHYPTPSQIKMGQRFFEKFEKLK